MSKKVAILVALIALAVLMLAPALHGAEEVSRLKWHTYAGSSLDDHGSGIAVDPSGSIYLAGLSDATWGSPIHPHSGGRDSFVAKLKRTGEVEWNTFLGPLGEIGENAIAVDGIGNVYVVGTSPFPGGDWGHFVAKLGSNGEMQWRRFGAETYSGVAETVAVDAVGSIYVGGWGGCWLAPGIHVGSGAWVAKLDSSGADVWHTCLGCAHGDEGADTRTLAVDASGNVYLTGRSNWSWGSPVNPYAGGDDAYAAKLSSNGSLQWNTFMGSPGPDWGSGVALDGSGNVYVSGSSEATWGTPVNPHAGGDGKAFAAKLDSNGVRQWHTFMGGEGGALGWAIAADGRQNVFVTGVWGGEPLSHPGGFVTALNRDGVLLWNTFLEAILDEMTLDESGNVYVGGQSDVSWGTPVRPHAGGWDAFTAKIETSNPELGASALLWHHQVTGELYTWTLLQTTAVSGSYLTPRSLPDTSWQIRGLADFNADGAADILWHHQRSGDLYVWFMNGAVAAAGSYLTPGTFSDTRWRIRGLADFDGDGKADILWHHQTTGDLYVWGMNGSVVTWGSYLDPSRFADTGWQIRGVVDLSKDGKPDILWHHQATGDLYVWGLSGTAVTWGSYLTPARFADTRWQIRRVADFNDDGKPDLLWHHQTTGALYVWFLDGLAVSGGSYLTPAAFTDVNWQITPR